MNVSISVSLGELYDKISILEIKLEKIKDVNKLKNIKREFEKLQEKTKQIPIKEEHYQELKNINLKLWNIEDEIRIKEFKKEFDDEFIRLARDVYITNDARSKIKRKINEEYGSDIVEEKSYEEY